MFSAEDPYDSYLLACAPNTTRLELHVYPDSLHLLQCLTRDSALLPCLRTILITEEDTQRHFCPSWTARFRADALYSKLLSAARPTTSLVHSSRGLQVDD